MHACVEYQNECVGRPSPSTMVQLQAGRRVRGAGGVNIDRQVVTVWIGGGWAIHMDRQMHVQGAHESMPKHAHLGKYVNQLTNTAECTVCVPYIIAPTC